jgi:hypothetical protein
MNEGKSMQVSNLLLGSKFQFLCIVPNCLYIETMEYLCQSLNVVKSPYPLPGYIKKVGMCIIRISEKDLLDGRSIMLVTGQ